MSSSRDVSDVVAGLGWACVALASGLFLSAWGLSLAVSKVACGLSKEATTSVAGIARILRAGRGGENER